MAIRLIVLVAIIFVMISIFGIVFNILFKIGVLLLLFTGVLYLVKKILSD